MKRSSMQLAGLLSVCAASMAGQTVNQPQMQVMVKGGAQGPVSAAPPASGLSKFAKAPGPDGSPGKNKDAAAASAAAPAIAGTTAQAGVTQIRPILQTRPVDTDHPSYGAAAFSSEGLNEQTSHITVGRSIFVDTKRRLARVYITDPDVIDSYTASPNQVVVTAKKAGATTLIMWDETGESKSYLISSDLNVEVLRESMKVALPNQAIKVMGNEGRVVLTGMVATKDVAEAAVKLAGVYSKEVSNALTINTALVKQVRLEVKIIEADRSKLAQFGFNFFSNGGSNPGSTSTGQYPSTFATQNQNGQKTFTLSNPLNFFAYVSKYNVGATLQDLETMQVLQILAEPNITAMSGEKADFLAGGEFPFPVIQSSSTGTPVVSLMFKQYGVKLQFLPVVNEDGTIDLKVSPEVSALDYTNSVSIAGYTIPAISTRRAETEVVLKSGQTFGISGLLDKRTTDLYSKTPGIAAVPVLGELFKSKGVNHSDTELMVMVTPTLVDPLTDAVPDVVNRPTIDQHIPFLDQGKFDSQLPKGATKP